MTTLRNALAAALRFAADAVTGLVAEEYRDVLPGWWAAFKRLRRVTP